MVQTTPVTTLELLLAEEVARCLPCDLSSNTWLCPNFEARWILRKSCGCTPIVACDCCKEVLLTSDDAIECGQCAEVFAPARHGYVYVEAL